MKRTLLLLSFLLNISASLCIAAGSYIEFSITTDKNTKAGNMTMYYQDGNTRSEMKMSMPQAGGTEMTFVMLSLKDAPGKSYMLDTKNKTYRESEIKENKMEESDSVQYDVTVIGKEKINGYNCTHCIVKRKNSTSQQEMWTTTEIKDFEKYKSIKNKYTSRGMYKALTDKGANGFPVRMKTMERNTNMIIDLVKAESRENPASLFSLDGYTKSTAPAGGMMTPEQMKEMREKIQSMTPEERQKYIDQMKQQSQPH